MRSFPSALLSRLAATTLAAALTATGVAVATAGAQRPLALRDALRAADDAAFANRAAAGATAAARAQTLAPLRGILPAVHVDAGYVRTTDPIGTFGATLRQRAITPADFEPSRLNYPSAVGNYQTAAVVEQPIFNADAWAGRRAARTGADAARAQESWIRLATHADVVRAYYGAILAGERAATLRDAAQAAHAHAAQAASLAKNGMATRSDALLAEVRAGEVDAQLASADGATADARRQLEVALGRSPTTMLALPAALPGNDAIHRLAVELAAADSTPVNVGPRADVAAAALAADAARADVDRARAAYVPRVNAFARYDWNSAARLYAGDKNWTVGVMASWTPFAGGADVADVEAARGRDLTARSQSDAAAARARLDAEQARTALAVAMTRLDIAARAVDQSAEAHRIVSRKYEGGLATVVELLDAQATETQSRLALAEARFAAISAIAGRRLNAGLDPSALSALDDAVIARAAADSSTANQR